MTETQLKSKEKKLRKYLNEIKNLAVAFSSGVDSTYLLKVASDILGRRVIAVTATSCFFPKRELDEAINFCKVQNIKHIIIKTEQLNIEGISQNPKNRCYLCKKELLTKIKKIAAENNIKNVAEGSNIDDESDYRPGLIAVKELNVISPLKYAGLTKNDIRILSREIGLPTGEKPSFACLASRFPYGEAITKEKLEMVDKAEQFLIDLGFKQVRVRIHNLMARIEVEFSEFDKLVQKNIREHIVKTFKNYGFTYISADLQGYRTGSMNEILKCTQDNNSDL